MALALIWLWNRYANRADRSPAIQRLMDDFAGRSLTKALGSLDSIVQLRRSRWADLNPSNTEQA
jgi:hypothetical protein